MNKHERKAAIAELQSRLEGIDRTRVPGVATADGIKPSWRATSVTDFGRFDAPEPVKRAIAAQEAREAAGVNAWVEAKREEQKSKIHRRAPRTRADILTAQLADHYAKFGTLPDSMMRAIVGEFWKQGTPVSVEQLRTYAGQKLNEAAQQYRERNGHRNEGVVVVGGTAS